MAQGKEDAPGQIAKAEESESDDILQASEEESTDDSEDTAETDQVEADQAEETDEGDIQVFRRSDAGGDSGASAATTSDGDKSAKTSGGSVERSSATSSSDFVKTASDCPNEKNQYGEFTDNGANTSGAYDSTCDEDKMALNGGKEHPKHCAGCVGNADNKNPRGQFPDGSDANNGYECDGNNGVGKTNPAHSGCDVEVTPPRKPPTTSVPPVKRPPLPDVVKRPSVPEDRVLPRQPFARPPEVPKFKPRQRIQGILPVTGPSQLLPFVWLALSLIAAGIAALISDRRRRMLGARDW